MYSAEDMQSYQTINMDKLCLYHSYQKIQK